MFDSMTRCARIDSLSFVCWCTCKPIFKYHFNDHNVPTSKYQLIFQNLVYKMSKTILKQ